LSSETEFRVGGLVHLTTVEWAGHLAAVVFAQGCPWRCRYCHNTRLVPTRSKSLIPWAEALTSLQDRQGFIDAVVFSGGEPLAQSALLPALQDVRALGYQTALHTGGCNPTLLGKVLKGGLVDHVSMDVKAPWERYEEVTRASGSGKRAQRSANLILQSGVAHEFRTTYHSELLRPDEVRAIAEDLRWRGARVYYLQHYRDEGSPDMAMKLSPSRKLPERLLRELRAMFETFGVRG